MSQYLPTTLQEYIHLSRYSRWLPTENRRETWEETVDRYITFMDEHLNENHHFASGGRLKELKHAILNLEVMPSMRALMTSGPALKKENLAGFNCSYTVIDRPTAFDEVLYILMNGTGVGFSVERQYVNKLPEVPEELFPSDTTIEVGDSKLGWAKAYRELIHLLYAGQVPKWDLSKVRLAGAPLKTFGGRASGPGPLAQLFEFTCNVFRTAVGRRLSSIECHDLVCKVAEIVVVGGVRRSALISLSNLSDDRMRLAKSGQWWERDKQRRLANNSAAYTEKPDMGIFMEEWLSLYQSKSGERGVFNRVASKRKAAENGRRDATHEFGTNPCGEILLRPNELCNLSEVVIRAEDTLESLLGKVRLATILGTYQSTLTNFRYVSKKWKTNCEEERLLGVSLTGVLDNKLTNTRGPALVKLLQEMKQVAIDTNKEYAEKFGVPQSVAITCIKPSGTVSQLVGTASGIHPRFAPFYIRTIRADKKDPLATMMKDAGFPVEDDVMAPDHTYIFSFPIKSSPDAVFTKDLTAIEHLELWKVYRDNWCEHNPSITVNVREGEWLEVAAWVYKNFDDIGGVSFLPMSEHIYQQAPYQEVTEEAYDNFMKLMPKNIDWSKLIDYEKVDATTGAQELACVAGGCEI